MTEPLPPHLERQLDKVSIALSVLASWTGAVGPRHLGAMTEAADMAEVSLREAISTMRHRGVTWDEIGAGLGISRQAAWRKYGRVAGQSKRP